jgi:hypothetical protein
MGDASRRLAREIIETRACADDAARDAARADAAPVTPEQRVADAAAAGRITPDDTMPPIERVRELAGRYSHDDEAPPFEAVALALGYGELAAECMADKLHARRDACTVGGLY